MYCGLWRSELTTTGYLDYFIGAEGTDVREYATGLPVVRCFSGPPRLVVFTYQSIYIYIYTLIMYFSFTNIL